VGPGHDEKARIFSTMPLGHTRGIPAFVPLPAPATTGCPGLPRRVAVTAMSQSPGLSRRFNPGRDSWRRCRGRLLGGPRRFNHGDDRHGSRVEMNSTAPSAARSSRTCIMMIVTQPLARPRVVKMNLTAARAFAARTHMKPRRIASAGATNHRKLRRAPARMSAPRLNERHIPDRAVRRPPCL
jgi:hypothetical protein